MSSNDFGNVPNPYEATVPPPLAAPGTGKPVSLTVFGIINIVWGLLSLCSFGATGVQLFVLNAQPQAVPNPVLETMRNNAVYSGFMIVSLGLGFIATIALIAGGIGLLNGKLYGRTLSIAYAIYAIFFGLLGMVFNLLFMVEPTMGQLDNIAEGPERTAATAGVIIFMVGAGICGLIYPIVLLVFMMRTPIVNYLRGQAQPHV